MVHLQASHLPFSLTTSWLLCIIFRMHVGLAHEQEVLKGAHSSASSVDKGTPG